MAVTGEVPRLLVTGSRTWTDEGIIRDALRKAWIDLGSEAGTVLVSGDCPTGADAIAEAIWERAGFPVERHPADWDRYGRRAGPVRNQAMVDSGIDLCVAFMLPGSKGTAHCVRAALKAGIPVRVHDANGPVVEHAVLPF